MKKILLSTFVIVSFVLYSFHLRGDDSHTTVSLKPASQGSATSPTTSSTTQPTTYKDGQYVGAAADAFYGNIQVKAIIVSGKITDVQFLQYPNDQPNSIDINQQAMPFLRQEAIKAQSAHVNGVTGATDTSQAFVQSLSSALSKAL